MWVEVKLILEDCPLGGSLLPLTTLSASTTWTSSFFFEWNSDIKSGVTLSPELLPDMLDETRMSLLSV